MIPNAWTVPRKGLLVLVPKVVIFAPKVGCGWESGPSATDFCVEAVLSPTTRR
jgi:hypothetical protein